MDTIILLTVVGLAVWFWLDSARAREIATERARTECRRRGLLFLDDTVSLRRVRLRTTPRGLRFRRQFDFDFNDGTEARYRGGVTVLGAQVADFDLGGWRDERPPGAKAVAGVEVPIPTLPALESTRETPSPEYGGNVIPLRRRQ